jgi:AcrR family transcriptional regulator
MPIAKIKQNKERRQKLLESAVKLFIEKGYFNTSIRDIIVLSEIGTGTFYNYFIDKEDVLKALLEEFADKIISSIKVYYQEETDIYVRFVETKRVTMEVFIQNEALSEIYSRVAGASAPIHETLAQRILNTR